MSKKVFIYFPIRTVRTIRTVKLVRMTEVSKEIKNTHNGLDLTHLFLYIKGVKGSVHNIDRVHP